MEKLILALVTAARKLRPYFQAHTIEIPTEHPMKQVLHKLETSGRLMKWAIELSEFDIKYKPKTTIKGHIWANFIMEFTSIELIEAAQTTFDLLIWRLSVDGTANAQGSGADLILTSSEGIDIEYALRFGFRASNNEAGYEAVIAGVNLAHSMEVGQLEVCSDSQLVVKQIEDSYEARGEKMILYLKKVRELLKKFVRVQVRHIPRVENSRADALTGNSLPRRPQQTDACRAPFRALCRSQQRRGLPCHIRAELDRSHLGLLNRKTTTKRPE